MPGFDKNEPVGSFGRTTWKVLVSPSDFFRTTMADRNWSAPLIYMAVCVTAHVAMVALLSKNTEFAARSLAMGLTFPFITAGLLYLILSRIFKARGSYLGALQVTAYASAVTLFSWMRGVGLLLEFYRLVIMGLGLATTFRVSRSKAFVAIAGTMAAYIVVSLLVNAASGGRLLEVLKD